MYLWFKRFVDVKCWVANGWSCLVAELARSTGLLLTGLPCLVSLIATLIQIMQGPRDYRTTLKARARMAAAARGLAAAPEARVLSQDLTDHRFVSALSWGNRRVHCQLLNIYNSSSIDLPTKCIS